MRFQIVMFVAAWLAATPAAAQTQEPRWAEPIFKSDAPLYYPARASEFGRTGEAVIECDAQINGVLKDCIAISETPTGENFSDAARMMALRKAMKVAPAPAVERVRVKVQFGGQNYK